MFSSNTPNTRFRILLESTNNCFRISYIFCFTISPDIEFVWGHSQSRIIFELFQVWQQPTDVFLDLDIIRRIFLQPHNAARDIHRMLLAYRNILRLYILLCHPDTSNDHAAWQATRENHIRSEDRGGGRHPEDRIKRMKRSILRSIMIWEKMCLHACTSN